MQRYFVDFKPNDKLVNITGADVHHIKNVMRMKPGEAIYVANAYGAYYAVIKSINSDYVEVELLYELKQNSELPVKVTIAQGMPKADKFETVIQKATELGVTELIPVLSERSLVKIEKNAGAKKLERFEKIAKSAAEQSHRLVIPSIKEFLTLKELILYSQKFTYKCVAYEASDKLDQGNLSRILQEIKPDESLLVFVGPEGGISEKEITLLQDNGFQVISLGNRILRTETAPLFVMSVITYELELRKAKE